MARTQAPSTGTNFPGVDLDLLAYDIADMLDRLGYPVDIADSHIRPALPTFLSACLANAAADDDAWEAGAMHGGPATPGRDDPPFRPIPEAPVPQQGWAPRMAYAAWFATQGVEIGAITADEWCWRCPVTGCRVWAGPYRNDRAAKQIATDHRRTGHDAPAGRRTEARKAARRVCPAMTAARFDETIARLATAHGLTATETQAAVHRTAVALDGLHTTHKDVLFYTGKSLGTARNGDYGLSPHPRVVALISAIAAELGHPGWLEDWMAADARRR